MRQLLVLLCWSCLATTATAQHKIIVAIGSSTTAGQGATPNPNPINPNDPPDSCWTSILKRYYKDLGLIDTLINLGRSGTTTYDGMPTGTVRPDGTTVATQFNVTAALQVYHADIVTVNYPTNDVGSGYSPAQTLSNLQTIYNTVVNAGKICFITTTQPRTSFTTDQKQLLKSERNMILDRFGHQALNFYNGIVAADSLNINPVYNYDGTHVNNAGHRVLFGVARDSNVVLTIPLPITLIGFTAVRQQQKIVLNWTGMDQTGDPEFVIQRSADGTSFEDQVQIPATGSGVAQNYSWTDQTPLAGKSYYRIKVSENGLADQYSAIVAVTNSPGNWTIGRLYQATASTRNIEIMSEKTTRLQLRIIDAGGRHFIQQSLTVTSSPQLDPPEPGRTVRRSVFCTTRFRPGRDTGPGNPKTIKSPHALIIVIFRLFIPVYFYMVNKILASQ
ncbi:SGNH/GDSL hydrolase family protein [Puia sp. P3]|uniref:SGNH/GDSL hydrolase family protein n=1 Tax=Puia sp. P3 TaxID=3423952 RepID=UPI003D670CD6